MTKMKATRAATRIRLDRQADGLDDRQLRQAKGGLSDIQVSKPTDVSTPHLK
jgi:hypothetical protein